MSGCSYWTDYTTSELLQAVEEKRLTVAILPVGAVEAHGKHLPLGTDSMLVDYVLENATADIDGEDLERAVVLPTMSVGASEEHGNFAGTLTISDDTLLDLWMQIACSVHRAGIRKILVLNGHGGQTQNVEILIRRLRFEKDMLAIGFHLQRFWSALCARRSNAKDDIHGGWIETSVMLAVQSRKEGDSVLDRINGVKRPQLVRSEHLENFKPEHPKTPGISPYGNSIMFGWRSEDLNSSGVLGDAASASLAKGSELLAEAQVKIASIVSFAHSFDLSRFDTSSQSGQSESTKSSS